MTRWEGLRGRTDEEWERVSFLDAAYQDSRIGTDLDRRPTRAWLLGELSVSAFDPTDPQYRMPDVDGWIDRNRRHLELEEARAANQERPETFCNFALQYGDR